MSLPEQLPQEVSCHLLSGLDIAPLGATLDWDCRELIEAVQETHAFVKFNYGAVQICCAVISNAYGNPEDTNFVFILPADDEPVASPPGPRRWKIPNAICNVASGCVDDDRTNLEWHAKAQAAADIGIAHTDCTLSLAGVFESEIEGHPILFVAVLIEVPVEPKSMSGNTHARPNVQVISKEDVEEMGKNEFKPEVLRRCILAAYEVRDRRRAISIASA